MGVCPGAAEGYGDVFSVERRDGETDVWLDWGQDGVGHWVEFECDVGDDAEETEVAGCCFEVVG